jgi:hypothetical protein
MADKLFSSPLVLAAGVAGGVGLAFFAGRYCEAELRSRQEQAVAELPLAESTVPLAAPSGTQATDIDMWVEMPWQKKKKKRHTEATDRTEGAEVSDGGTDWSEIREESDLLGSLQVRLADPC